MCSQGLAATVRLKWGSTLPSRDRFRIGEDRGCRSVSGGRPWPIFQVQLFPNDLQALIEAGWEAPPDLNIAYLQCLASGTENCPQ